ncbi:MAG: hypothetical protein ACOZNI_29340 [Myxococcota bacterium]
MIALVAAALAEEQVVRVLLKGGEPGMAVLAERPGQPAVEMTDPGIGVLAAELRGDPARFLPLRLVGRTTTGDRVLYDGTLVLADARAETVAFTYSRDYGARRIPVAPSAKVDLALDPRTSVWISFGWGGLAVAYFAVLALAQAIRSRR